MRETQALILAPTRELAGQIQKVGASQRWPSPSCGRGSDSVCPQVLLALGDYMNVQCHACIGGTNVGEDIRKLDYGQHVVSGTPGRVFGEQTELGQIGAWPWGVASALRWDLSGASRQVTFVCVQT